ncbi:MAG TPA: alpha/beta hydrolase [Myxococcaceae bacterium]|nr:alpha/beta hydrolase [Myxococcaceae bacterium]
MPMIEVKDLQVHYREHGQGEPLVLVHGNWTTSLWWQPTLELLPPGLRALTYNMRGRGHTRGPDTPQALPRLAEDLRGLMEALGLERAHLVGHSLGSAVVMQLALESPQRVRSLTLVAPPWADGMPAAYNQPAMQLAAHEDRNVYAAALRGIAPGAPDDALWQQLVDEGHRQRREASLATLQALVDWSPGERLQALRTLPSLVISGTKDLLSTVEVGQRCAHLLGARHHVMEGVGHSPNLEATRDFVTVLEQFLHQMETRPLR